MTRPLFDALDEISVRLALAPHLLLCLDFDGTLTPLVDEPALVCLSGHMRRVLESLAGQDNVSLAIVSGRERGDLQAHVGIPGLLYAGNHGLEISGDGFIFVEPTAVECRPALQSLATLLVERLRPIPAAVVEDKGLTLSVHYRLVPAEQRDEVRRTVAAALASMQQPLQLTTGDMVYEVKPRGCWNKGAAVSWIKQQLGKPDALTIYLGDDVTDETAFAALPDGITVKVGSSPATAARYQLDGPAEVRCFLDGLDDLLSHRPGPAPARVATGH
jgi:trehalose 6-phosphate phosphatase